MIKQGRKIFTKEERVRAVRLVSEGWSAARVAEALGCSSRAIQGWVQKSDGGRDTSVLETIKPPGAAPKLDAKQQRRLLQLLSKGPEANGFEGQLWTAVRAGEVIEREFGVSYHPKYLPSLLRSLGWTPQKAKRRAIERDEPTVEHWVQKAWPRIKKNAAGSTPRSSSSTKQAF